MIKLKPCPFCGGEAEFERAGTARMSTIVSCTECGATLESGEAGEMAGTSWNSRETDEQLAIANERVEELELIVVAITHADETGYVDDVGFVEGWSEVCDETKQLLNKFALEQKIEGAKCYARKLHSFGLTGVWDMFDSVCEQLRKEQEK